MARQVLAPAQLQLGARSKAALTRLEEQGIGAPDKPADKMPRPPRNLPDLNEAELMGWLSEMTAWVGFLGTQLAAASVDEKDAESALDKLRAIGAVKNRSEKTVSAAKARVYEDEEFNDANDVYLTHYAYRKLVESRWNAADRYSAILSRELTRRTSRSDRDNRNNRLNT